MKLRELSKLIAGRKLSGLSPKIQDEIITKLKDFVPENRIRALMLGDVTGLELVAFVTESPVDIANEAFGLSIISIDEKAMLLEDIREYDEDVEDEDDVRHHQILTGITATAFVSLLFLFLSHAFITLNAKHLPTIPQDQSLSIIGKILELSLIDRVRIEEMEGPTDKPPAPPPLQENTKEEAPPPQEDIPIDEMSDEQLENMLRKTNRELTSLESQMEDNVEFAEFNK